MLTGITHRNIAQIGLIVRDVEAITDAYNTILGFPLPEIRMTSAPGQAHALYYGIETNARGKMALFVVDTIEFELMQPIDAPSAWKDFLDERNDGIHHMAFFVPDTKAVIPSIEKRNYLLTHQGLFIGERGTYSYFNTEAHLGVALELAEHFDGAPAYHVPHPSEEIGIGTNTICQLGIVVRDIEHAIHYYCTLFDMPRPPIIETRGYADSKTTFRGKPSEATAKLAFFDFGQVQIELIQPDEKPSVWREFLTRCGNGAHHIAFQLKDTQKAVEYLARHNIQVIQQGLYADGSGMYTYMDSERKLGCMIELLENYP